MSCTPRDQRKAQASLRIRKAINCLTAHKVVIDGILYELETENATLRARIAELESAAKGDRTLIESGEFVRDAQAKRIAELTEWRPMEDAPDTDCLLLDWEYKLQIGSGSGYATWKIMGTGDDWFVGWLPLPPTKGKDT